MTASDRPTSETTTFNQPPRLALIDIAKGLGILLIALGHNSIYNAHYQSLAELQSAFLVPFFFLISGVTFKVGTGSFRQLVLDRADALLKPMVVVVLLTAPVYLATGRINIEMLVLQLVYATGFTLMWTPIWFLPHLWLLNVCAAWLLRSSKKLSDRPWKQGVLVAVLLIAGYFIMKQFDSGFDHPVCRRGLQLQPELFSCGLPFSVDLLLLTAAFFLLGHFLAARIKQFTIHGGLLLLAVLVMAVCRWAFDQTLDLNWRRYDSLVVCSLQAFSGIYIMLCVCSALERFSLSRTVFSYCGRGSLFILIFHATMVAQISGKLLAMGAPELVAALAAFFVPVMVSLAIWEVCCRVAILSWLMLPIKRPRQPTVLGGVAT